MDKEKTIHEFDMELISEYYSKLKRQGPGSPEMTIKALSFIDNLPECSKIADIGCGTGGQAMVLAQNTASHITGVDLFPDCWIDNYFAPQIPLYDEFLKKYNGNKIVEEFIEGNRNEERMYHKYKDYYGYVFYIGKKF